MALIIVICFETLLLAALMRLFLRWPFFHKSIWAPALGITVISTGLNRLPSLIYPLSSDPFSPQSAYIPLAIYALSFGVVAYIVFIYLLKLPQKAAWKIIVSSILLNFTLMFSLLILAIFSHGS